LDQPESYLEQRRSFLKYLATSGIIAGAGVLSVLRILTYVPSPTLGSTGQQVSWPKLRLINVSMLKALKLFRFNYPLTNTPNYLVKLGVKAEYGVGPDSDIVAFSAICQHLGCFYRFEARGMSPPCNPSYKARVPMGYCCCHGSQYDFTHDAKVIGGPAPRPVPRVDLEYDHGTGDLYVVGMEPPTIYGHGPPGTTNPTDVLRYDLQGGNIVTENTISLGEA
jgi:arsenite oxidase small subunit